MTQGIIQLVLVVIAWIFNLTLIGIIIGGPLGLGVWIWALILSIIMLQK